MAFFLKMNIVLFLGPGLLRTILVVVLIYYGSKFLFKWWLKRKMDAPEEKNVEQCRKMKLTSGEMKRERFMLNKIKVHHQQGPQEVNT